MSQISVLVTIKSNRAQYQEDSIKYQVTLNAGNFYTASFRAIIVDELANNTTLVKRDSDLVSIIVRNNSLSDFKIVTEASVTQVPTGDAENLMFNVDATYGTPTVPLSGTIAFNSDNFKPGVSILLLHNDTVEPTLDPIFKKLSGTYVINELNYIAFESLAEDHIIYSISQQQV